MREPVEQQSYDELFPLKLSLVCVNFSSAQTQGLTSIAEMQPKCI